MKIKETIRLWQDVRAFLNKEFPEAALVSEWGKPEVALEAGFDMDFYLHFGDTGYMDLFRGDHPYFGGDPESDISVFAGIFAKIRRICGERHDVYAKRQSRYGPDLLSAG